MHTCSDIPCLLVVDDDMDFSCLLERTLSSGGYQVILAESGERALEVLADTPVDLILLDIRIPGLDGFETCRRIKSSPATAAVPVVFMTAEGRSNEMLAQALRAGGSDCLTKPLSRADVLMRVRNLLQQRGESLWLRQLNADDEVTGLPGRAYFKSRLEEELSQCAQFQTPVSLVLAELDGLEQMCAQPGCSSGDTDNACVARFALLLRSESRRHDVAARVSQSCFGLLLPRVSICGAAAAAKRMSDIWGLAALPVGEDESSIPVFFAVEGHDGASHPPSSGDLLKRAGEALERAKQSTTQSVQTPAGADLLWPSAPSADTEAQRIVSPYR